MIRYTIGCAVLAVCTYVGGATAQQGGISPEAAAERQHIGILRLSVDRKLERKCIRNPYRPYQYPRVGAIPADRLRPIRKTWQSRERQAIRQPRRCNRIPAWPWLALARCESGLDWDYNGISGYDGGLQFHPDTWNRAKVLPEVRAIAARYAYAWQAPAYVQYRVAKAWLARTSWDQWPACASKLGLR